MENLCWERKLFRRGLLLVSIISVVVVCLDNSLNEVVTYDVSCFEGVKCDAFYFGEDFLYFE